MYKAAVIGAGYMGSAITFPLSANNIEVNLIGTWLDEDIIASSLAGYHPKLKKPLPGLVKPVYWQDMASAVKGTDIIFIAVTSEGFVNVFSQVLDAIDKNYYFFKLTKGLVSYKGSVVRATQAAHDMFKLKFPNYDFMWATVGGPVRALDLSQEIPSVSMYGITSKKIIDIILSFSTDYYRIVPNEDLVGVEVSSTFKNIYSIAPGICDGLYKGKKDNYYYNFVALLFSQAATEISRIVELTGGNKKTAFDFAGVGDLYVTSAAGRNRRYGELVGKGVNPDEAFNKMLDEGEYGEGYVALKLAIQWLKNIDEAILNELPLFNTLYRIIFENCNPESELKKFVTKIGS